MGREKRMRPPFRSKQEVIINAPLETVWEFNMDITKIPTFHPRVVKVELLSGKALREPGVSYQCHLSGGKHMCVEKDIEIVPMQKLVTVLPEDTFGISKIDRMLERRYHRRNLSGVAGRNCHPCFRFSHFLVFCSSRGLQLASSFLVDAE